MAHEQSGYSKTSIIVHWLTAIFIVVLFFSGEGGRDIRALHISLGAVLGVLLIWRVVRRMMRGRTAKPDQNALLNLVSSIVIWGLLLSIVVATVTGYLLPWTRGSALNVFDIISIPSPMASNRTLHEVMEEVHEISSHFFIPLTALHILGTLKHHFIDKDDVARRMIRAVKGGK